MWEVWTKCLNHKNMNAESFQCMLLILDRVLLTNVLQSALIMSWAGMHVSKNPSSIPIWVWSKHRARFFNFEAQIFSHWSLWKRPLPSAPRHVCVFIVCCSATGFYLTLFNVLNTEYLLMNCGRRRRVSLLKHNRYLNIHSTNSVTGDTLFFPELNHNVTHLTASLPVNLFTFSTFLKFAMYLLNSLSNTFFTASSII